MKGETDLKSIEWGKVVKLILRIIFVYLIVMMAVSMIESLMVLREMLTINTARLTQTTVSIILTFAACLIVSEKVGHGKLVVAVLMGIAIIAGLLLAGFLLCGQQMLEFDIRMAGVLSAACVAGLVSGRKRERR